MESEKNKIVAEINVILASPTLELDEMRDFICRIRKRLLDDEEEEDSEDEDEEKQANNPIKK